MRQSSAAAFLHRQARLGALQRLNLAFFIYAEHDGLGGRIEEYPAPHRAAVAAAILRRGPAALTQVKAGRGRKASIPGLSIYL